MKSLKDLIQRCHQRRAKPFQQRKTVAMPSMYTKGHFYQYRVYCARKYPVLLDDLEAADISFMPIGRAPENDRGPRHFGGELFRRRTRKENWGFRRWDTSWGIQVYTGIPSERAGARWHDLDFTYQALCTAPDAVFACIEALVSSVANPLLTLSKSGGLRFSCRVPDYLHPDTETQKLYIYKYTPTPGNPQQRDVYLEILGEKGYSRWDARYEILLGNLLDPPVIVKEALFAPIDALRAMLHQPAPEEVNQIPTIPAMPLRLGSYQLDLAKEAFMKRGFSYVRQDNGFHHWIPSAGTETDRAWDSKEIDAVEVLLWEDEGIMWVRASTPDVGMPTTATPITDVWDDTGIVPPVPKTGLPVTDKVLAVREGLSPLAIKRSPVILQKAEPTEKDHQTLDNNAIEIRRVLESSARVLGLIVSETGMAKHYKTEIKQHFQVPMPEMLESVDETLCTIKVRTAPELFPKCMILINTLQAWEDNWQGRALGNFAKTLRNALEIKGKRHSDAVKGVRAAIQSFEWQAEELVRQMCRINVRGKVVAGGVVDTDTGKELARLRIEFEGGGSAYIPLDDNAAAKFKAKGLPFFRLDAFVINEDMKIPMKIAEAIRLGILDTKTVENIQELPTVYSDPNWTFWHQLKHFFAHYTRDADAPVRWDGEGLHFWVPPVLHPRVKRLLVVSSTLSEGHLHRAFPDEAIEVLRTQPTAWIAGNQVFQIRTGIYPRETILDYDSTWDVIGVSKTGQRFLLGIRAEIERDPNVKHAIIADSEIIQPLQDITTASENVCFLRAFQGMIKRDIPFETFQQAEVIWILGAPERPPGLMWRRAQILFGNHEQPLSYETETGSNAYTDERLQIVYEQEVVSILTEIFECVKLNRATGKKVVLITGLQLPNITDRPETLLFDWEDLEVAGGLDKLAETIATRQRFETERDNLTAESSRATVEKVLGCSPRQANRVLQKLRGGKALRVPLREQILDALADGEMKTAELVAAIDGYPTTIKNKLRQLVDAGEIVKLKRAVYARKAD